jgi:hypothetical protein
VFHIKYRQKLSVLHRVKEERNKLHKIKMKSNCTGHILLRNCLLKHVIEEKDRGNDRNDGKARKKTEAATG